MDTSKFTILVPFFHLKFLNGICRLWRRNFKWAALASVPLGRVIAWSLT